MPDITTLSSQLDTIISLLTTLQPPPPRKTRSRSRRQTDHAKTTIADIRTALLPTIVQYGPIPYSHALNVLSTQWRTYRESARKRLDRYLPESGLTHSLLSIEDPHTGKARQKRHIYLDTMDSETAMYIATATTYPNDYNPIPLGPDGLPIPVEPPTVTSWKD